MVAPRVCLRTLLFIVAGLGSGCYESAVPLDPIPQLDADPALVGRWRCLTPDDDDAPITVTVERTAARTYAVTLKEEKHTPDRYEGYVSSVNGTTLVNLRNVKGGKKPWTFLQVSVLQPKVLFVQFVDNKLFKGVPETPQAVRATVERERLNPELFKDLCACVRMEPEKK